MLENKVPFLLVFSSSYVVDVGATDKKKKQKYVFINATLAFTTVLCYFFHCYLTDNCLYLRNFFFSIRDSLSQLISMLYFLSLFLSH